MLQIFDTEELRKLSTELYSLMRATPKNKRKDDLADALRYCAVSIPWDFETIKIIEEAKRVEESCTLTPEQKFEAQQIQERRGIFEDEKGGIQDEWQETADEIEYWNEQYG